MNNSNAVVLGLYGANGVGVVRSLGAENIPQVGFHINNRFPHAKSSKYLSSTYLLSDESELLESLLKFGESQNSRGVIFTTGDDYMLFVEKNADQLKPFYHLPLSSFAPLSTIVDKSKILDIGSMAGFDVPEHAKLSEEKVFDILFPVFLKPLYSVGSSKHDMLVVNSKDELNDLRQTLISKFKDMEVETFIPGPIKNQFEVHTYLTSAGNPLISMMLQYQSDFMDSSVSDLTGWTELSVYHPELVTPSNNLTELLKFSGPLDINLKQSSVDGKFYFNEVNMRPSANLMMDAAFGLNLPAIIYLDSLGLDYSSLVDGKSIRTGKRWISDRRIVGYTQQNIPINSDKLNDYILNGAVHSFFDPKDPAIFYNSLAKNQLNTLNVEVNLKNSQIISSLQPK